MTISTARATGLPAVRPYESYVYAYPHKTAYRPLPDRPALRELWAAEPKDALSLYLHIPFCEVRCGFCNLFTRIGAPEELTTRYLDALDRQAVAVRDALGDSAPVRFAAAAFGGGTPTFLTADELERLCDIAEKRMGADLLAVPLSVETSPSTATADRLAVLAGRGTTRVSIGVQSFVDEEARAAVRPQRRAEVEAALGRIRDARIPVLNIDLIYGIDGQTERTWLASLDAALAWRPEELYLYPLYVRPLTGLHRLGAAAGPEAEALEQAAWDEQRLRLYAVGRDHLLACGYEQVSMRMFRRADAPGESQDGPEDHACQTDGMIGLGCGARSYTAALHYSFDYAVDMREIRSIIDRVRRDWRNGSSRAGSRPGSSPRRGPGAGGEQNREPVRPADKGAVGAGVSDTFGETVPDRRVRPDGVLLLGSRIVCHKHISCTVQCDLRDRNTGLTGGEIDHPVRFW
ncbi:hypothetical protein SMICM304S_11357 [Streptomyces microflavus]